MKLRYKIIILLAIKISLIIGALYYVNIRFIPITLKQIIVKNLKASLQKEVEIGTLRFTLTKGFTISSFVIYEGLKKDTGVLLKADDVSFGVIYIPSLSKQRILIPRIALTHPYLKLRRSDDGGWNLFSPLLAKANAGPSDSRFSIIIKSISCSDGTVDFIDNYGGKNFAKKLSRLLGTVGLSLPQYVTLNTTGLIDGAPLRLIASYRIPQKDLAMELQGKDINLAEYYTAYCSTFKPRIPAGIFDGSVNIGIRNFQEIKIKGTASLKNLRTITGDITAAGNYTIAGEAQFNMKDLSRLTYNAKLSLEDVDLSLPIKSIKEISDIKGTLYLSQIRWQTKDLSCLLYNSPTLISGTLDAPHKDFIAQVTLSSTLPLKPLTDAFGLGIELGTVKIDTGIQYKKDKNYTIRWDAFIENLRMLQRGVIISGDYAIKGDASGIAGDWEAIAYKGTVHFNKAGIETTHPAPIISDAFGDATFGTRYLKIDRLQGIAADTKINMGGHIDYSEKEPTISMQLKSDKLAVSKFLSTLPEELRLRLKDIQVEGICSVDLAFSGTIGRPQTYIYEGKVLLQDSSVILPYWPNNISDIDAEILFKKQHISWHDLNFTINNARYHSYGSFKDPEAPQISLTLESSDLDAYLELKLVNEIINITKCSGKYHDSLFSIGGKITDRHTLYADLAGTIDLDLKDTPYLFPRYAEQLRKLRPGGVVKTTFTLQGPLRDITKASIFAEGNATTISSWGLQMNDFYFDYRMKDQFIDIPTLRAHPYGGTIMISSRMNLKPVERPYLINIDIKDVDLNKLIQDTEFKNKKIKGTFLAQAVLNGYFTHKNSLKGNGWLQVADGYLWEFPVMHGMMEVIFMMPPEYVTLTDAFGNFSVYKNRIYTEDLKILSKTASLLWAGSLGFDGSLDFGITGRFAEDIVKQATDPGKIAGAILREAGNIIMEIRLSGTIAKPSYKIVPFPIQKILQEKIFDKFRDIFGNMIG